VQNNVRKDTYILRNYCRDVLFEYHRAVATLFGASRLLTGIIIVTVTQNLRW